MRWALRQRWRHTHFDSSPERGEGAAKSRLLAHTLMVSMIDRLTYVMATGAMITLCVACSPNQGNPGATPFTRSGEFRAPTVSAPKVASPMSTVNGSSNIVKSNQRDVAPTDCADAFSAAASVHSLRDSHEDLFPAYSACTTIDEWRAAHTLYPSVIPIDPVKYAMSMCASYQEEIGKTPICLAVNAPPPADDTALRASGRTGLLGVPLPEGARLTERTSGSGGWTGPDPVEKYTISATADELADFFNRVLGEEGWFKDGLSSDYILWFEKGDLLLQVVVDWAGGKFSLSGS